MVFPQNAVERPPPFLGGWVGSYCVNFFVVVWVFVVGFGFGGWASMLNFIRQIDSFGLFTKCYQCPPHKAWLLDSPTFRKESWRNIKILTQVCKERLAFVTFPSFLCKGYIWLLVLEKVWWQSWPPPLYRCNLCVMNLCLFYECKLPWFLWDAPSLFLYMYVSYHLNIS